MKIFVDSADIKEIKEAFSWGVVDGVTTNPSLIKKAIAGKEINMATYIEELLKITNNCPVSLEVDGTVEGKIVYSQMVQEAVNIYNKFKQFNPNLNIKIPVNPAMSSDDDHQFDGLKTIKELNSKGIPVNATLIMTPEQGLLAAKAGARFISPFMGRIDDYIGAVNPNAGVELVEDTIKILKNYHFHTAVIGASTRNIKHIRELAKLGTEIATIPFKLLKEMITHPKSFEGVRTFKDDVVPEYRELLRS